MFCKPIFSFLAASLFFQMGIASDAMVRPDSLPVAATLLPEVVVQRSGPIARVQGDSISFGAKRWMDPGVTKLEDLLKKIPGFQVEENGRILFNGKAISRILIDGDDLTGLRYNMLSRNLRAVLVDTVQVIGQYHEHRLMKGFVSGDQVAVNLKISSALGSKISGTLALSKALTAHGKIDLDLTRLLPAQKQLLFLNANNTGDPGVVDRTMVDGSGTAGEASQRFSSWPFGAAGDELFAALPNAYKKINQDRTLLYMRAFPMGRYRKMRINTYGLHGSDTRNASRLLELPFKDQLPLTIYSTLYRQERPREMGINLQLDVDKGAQRSTRFALQLGSRASATLRNEERSGMGYTAVQLQDSLKTRVLEAEYQETWLLHKRRLLVFSNKLAMDQNTYAVQTAGYPEGLLVPNGQGVSNRFELRHGGAQASSAVVLMHTATKWSWQLGWRNQVDHLRSAVHQRQMLLWLFRSYPHAVLAYQHSKKIRFETQLAGGIGLAETHTRIRVANPVYQFEQALHWKPRVMEELRVSYRVAKRTPDLHAFHAGPLFTGDGAVRYGSDSLVFPLQRSVQLDLRKHDLYRGLTISVVARLSVLNNELAAASIVEPVVEGSRFFLRPTNKMFFLSAGVEKFIHPLKLRIKTNSTFNTVHAIQAVNALGAQATLTTVVMDQRLITQWKGIYQCEGHHVVSLTHFGSGSLAAPASVRRQQYGLVQHLNFKAMFQGRLTTAVIRFGAGPYFPLADISMRSAISAVWTASINLSNLFHQRSYVEHTAGAFQQGFQEIQLNGRRVLFTLQRSF